MPTKKTPETPEQTAEKAVTKTTVRKTAAKKAAPADKSTTVVVVTTNGTPKPCRKKTQSPMTKVKRKIAKVTGIPTTASGRKKKAERKVADLLLGALDKLDKPKK